MSDDRVAVVSAALQQTFKDRVTMTSGQPFEDTGVTLPNPDVWTAYAESAVRALELRDAELLTSAPAYKWQAHGLKADGSIGPMTDEEYAAATNRDLP